jgi:hypothetical protein
MHYKNGRPAQSGDKVVNVTNGNAIVGILHSVNAQTTTCNGRIAAITPNDPYVNIGDCLHADDVGAAAAAIPVCDGKN